MHIMSQQLYYTYEMIGNVPPHPPPTTQSAPYLAVHRRAMSGVCVRDGEAKLLLCQHTSMKTHQKYALRQAQAGTQASAQPLRQALNHSGRQQIDRYIPVLTTEYANVRPHTNQDSRMHTLPHNNHLCRRTRPNAIVYTHNPPKKSHNCIHTLA